ncbi:OLC1v1021087C2 [Oldenlandia corymbosa var. corymbosa]|uniref:OLC1v1021087C2 n=1 Tax=Oldenlandia corymbosa var. corymbosa TaxID=529605 RepID=A0AAV1BVI8_OLDCO|nr:OLC1v1021087C2 [Oldenlandia corymbosa var. corymbosa]
MWSVDQISTTDDPNPIIINIKAAGGGDDDDDAVVNNNNNNDDDNTKSTTTSTTSEEEEEAHESPSPASTTTTDHHLEQQQQQQGGEGEEDDYYMVELGGDDDQLASVTMMSNNNKIKTGSSNRKIIEEEEEEDGDDEDDHQEEARVLLVGTARNYYCGQLSSSTRHGSTNDDDDDDLQAAKKRVVAPSPSSSSPPPARGAEIVGENHEIIEEGGGGMISGNSSLFSWDQHQFSSSFHHHHHHKEEAVYVVVSSTTPAAATIGALEWTLLQNPSSSTTVFLVHVFPQIKHIPTPLGMMAISQVNPEQKDKYLSQQRDKRREFLHPFINACSAPAPKVKVETILIESDMEAQAILDLIPVLNITLLLLPTTKPILRKMRSKKSSGSSILDQILRDAPELCETGKKLYRRRRYKTKVKTLASKQATRNCDQFLLSFASVEASGFFKRKERQGKCSWKWGLAKSFKEESNPKMALHAIVIGGLVSPCSGVPINHIVNQPTPFVSILLKLETVVELLG